jgi:hypothetical protein
MATSNLVSDAAIFSRIWDISGPMTADVARQVLNLRFDPSDIARTHELAERCRSGLITEQEEQEYDTLIRVGDLLAVMQSKARLTLTPPKVGRSPRA